MKGLTPWFVLAIIASLLAAVWLFDRLHSRRRRRRLGKLAAEHRWRFNATDRFDLAARIVPHVPVPGAGDIHVRDLMYRLEGDTYRYVFTTLCTAGTITGPDRVRLVILAGETAGGSLRMDGVADAHLSTIEQYAALIAEAEGTERDKGMT
jgi:hypothetical protein